MSDGESCIIFIVVVFLMCILGGISYHCLKSDFVPYYDGAKKIYVDNTFLNHNKAGEILSKLDDNNIMLIEHLNSVYLKKENLDNPNNQIICDGIRQLSQNYQTNNIRENVPTSNSADTSFSINKGSTVAICLRNMKQDYKFHDMNLLSYVVLHELAHIFSKSYGHGDEFWINFKFILKESKKIGIIELIDYSKFPAQYCTNMIVTYNPVFDKNVIDLV